MTMMVTRMVEYFPLSQAPLEKEPNSKLSQEYPKYKTEVDYNPVKKWEETLPTAASFSSFDGQP